MRALAALVVLALAPGAAAQTVEARLADLRLASAVRLALVADAATRGLDVDVSARDGAVALAGPGASDARAEAVARAVPGVRAVSTGGPRAPRPEPADAPEPDDDALDAPEPVRLEPVRTEPARPDAVRDAGPAVHVVLRGETLFSLAPPAG